MTHDQKINYMRIAAGIAGFGINNHHLDLLVSLYELVVEKEGTTDMKTVIGVEEEVKKRADANHRSELLDKVSEKTGSSANE